MKKIFFSGIFALLVAGSFDATAQVVGGSAGRGFPSQQTSTTKKVESDKGVFDNPFYIKVGLSSPMGKFGQQPSADQSLIASFNGQDGTGAVGGINFELGWISYLRSIPIQEQFKIGIDFGFSATTNGLDWSSLGGGYTTADTYPFSFFGVKIGPAVSYNVIDNLIVDGFLKLNPMVSKPGEIYSYHTGSTSTSNAIDVSWVDPTFAMKKSLGVNVRYTAFLVGMEVNWGKIEYTIYDDYPGGGSSHIVKTPTTVFLLTGGLKF